MGMELLFAFIVLQIVKKQGSFVDRAFWLSLIIKGIDGALQLIGGVAVLFIEPGTLSRWFRYLTRYLLHRKPHNSESNFIHSAAAQFGISVETLVCIYLLSHGVIKVLLVYGLLKRKLWVFPAALAGFGFFLAVEIYRISEHFYWGILILMCVDIFVITMVILEYMKVKKKKEFK